MTANPILTGMDENGRVAYVKFIDGRAYKLQHPGNRIYLDWQKDFFSVTEGVDQAKFLDRAFEYCVIPDGHDFRPSVDNVKPRELGVWQRLLRRFLDGDLGAIPDGKGTDVGRAAPGRGAKDTGA